MSRRRTGSGRRSVPAGTRQSPVRRVGPAPPPPLPDNVAPSPEDDPQGLTVNLWFDSGHAPAPYAATLRLVGRRVGAERPSARDSFVREETIYRVMPDSGPVSLTTSVLDVNPGEWTVSAEMISPRASAPPSRRHAFGASSVRAVHRAQWSWLRWRLTAGPAAPIKTRFAPLTEFSASPAVIPGSWTALVALGVVLGFVVQARLLPREHIDAGSVFWLSLLTVAAGVIGAKLWFVALRRTVHGVWRVGMCIQGALVGAAAVMLAGLALLHLPIGAVLDATTPGLFFGIAVGRVGCFLTGCCAGRLSASRWAIWSSDRKVGARRIPTQLLESISGLVIGVAGLLVIVRATPTTTTSGALFVASFAAYTLVRQLLLRLRFEARKTSRGGQVTAAIAAAVLAASVAVLIIVGR